MDALQIGSRREVCWDEYLIDTTEGIHVRMHQPEFREVVMTCNKPWEGCNCGYFVLIREADCYRVYYRGLNCGMLDSDGKEMKNMHDANLCYATTVDGIHFEREPVNEKPFLGMRRNNIILEREPDNMLDNVFVFLDQNPDCPPEERYKALSGTEQQQLIYYKSADGIHFERTGVLLDDGTYDSLNVCFWDPDSKQYFLYYRGLHGPDTKNGKWNWPGLAPGSEARLHGTGIVRDIRLRTSPDFVNWGPVQMLDYGPDAPDRELYTNCIQKYYRADHMFIGFPTRYLDRYKAPKNFPHLPGWKHRQLEMGLSPRYGTAITETAIMTSRDGEHFHRTEEAWLTPGYEREFNWYYGDGYFAHGMIETASDQPGAPNEISMYTGRDVDAGPVQLCRYAVRLDGFFSWHCDYKPGKLVTKSFVFEGDKLSINFASSVSGYVRIRLLDKEGQYLEGYDSEEIFGNSVDRPVEFDAPLGDLAGKEIRMEITMSDADLYSFMFSKTASF